MDEDIESQIEECAQHCDDKTNVIKAFIDEDLSTCQGYVLIWVDKDDRVSHVRWNMRPWKVRGAINDVVSYLSAEATANAIEGE